MHEPYHLAGQQDEPQPGVEHYCEEVLISNGGEGARWEGEAVIGLGPGRDDGCCRRNFALVGP